MLEQRVKANVGVYSVPAVVHVVQGDTGRVLIFEIEDYTLTGSETASLMCIRPDQTAFSYAGVVHGPEQTVEVPLASEGGALTQAGVVAAQLVLALSGEVVCSFKLGIIVEEVLGGEATQEDITFLAGLQAQLDQAIGRFVESTREINGHDLSADITLTPADIGAVPTTRTVNGAALTGNVTLKSAQFAESITGEKMLAALTYRIVSTWS